MRDGVILKRLLSSLIRWAQMRSANERRRYILTSSLIGWGHTHNDSSGSTSSGPQMCHFTTALHRHQTYKNTNTPVLHPPTSMRRVIYGIAVLYRMDFQIARLFSLHRSAKTQFLLQWPESYLLIMGPCENISSTYFIFQVVTLHVKTLTTSEAIIPQQSSS